jgi:hypothetical protein
VDPVNDLAAMLERIRPANGYVQLTISGRTCFVKTKQTGMNWSCVTIGETPEEACRKHIHTDSRPNHYLPRDEHGRFCKASA